MDISTEQCQHDFDQLRYIIELHQHPNAKNICHHVKVFLLPSGYIKIAIETGPVERVDNYPAIKWWIFPWIFVNVYQREKYS